ncbi:MAG: cytochrome c3 family protein [Planctomycetota bacterium]
MKGKRAHFWIALLSTSIVALIAIVDVSGRSPGPLTGVHGRIPELADSSNCSACHGGWTSSMTSACLDCHEVIGKHIERGEGLHGTLPENKANDCARCHSDHHGEGFAIVNLQSFVQAGISHPDNFNHDRIGWEMAGKHLELTCAECHTNADVRLLPEGEHRFLGLEQSCSTCHEDSHEGQMALACAQCHGQESFTELHSLGHERRLPLIGGHGDVSCRECHVEDTERSLEELGRPGHDLAPRKCQECHDSPHEQSFVKGVARAVERSPGASCVTCHVSEHTSFRERDLEPGSLTVSDELHEASGFPLRRPHREVSCEECHGTADEPFEVRYPGRGRDECSACHESPHGTQFESGPFSQGDCVACHERQHFDPPAFGVKKHERARLALTGAHLELECEACHELPALSDERVFRGTPTKCDGCHPDAHDGFFAPHGKELKKTKHGMCAACHEETSFSDLPPDGFDHHRFTEFPLEGAHAQEACESCHKRTESDDIFGRSFGRIATRYGQIEGCESCHADPHRGEFDGAGLPRFVDGRAGCARCHTTLSFRALASDWDHRRWTGFPLKGAHARAECADCHKPIRSANGADPIGRTWERAHGDRCADCHENPHSDQFELRGETSCERCHESPAGWDELDFNHDVEARFPLGEAHRSVECSRCHLPSDPRDDTSFIRYRPLPMDCVDCHGTHEGPSLKRRGK